MRKGFLIWSIFLALLILFTATPIFACTTIIVGKELTKDGSVLVAHNEELGDNAAQIYTYVPRKVFEEGEVYTFLSGAAIPQPAETFAYIGSRIFDKEYYPGDFTTGINEYQVTVANNMAWTRDYADENDDPWEVNDSGVIWTEFTQLVLERAKTAREGVILMGYLVENYGLTGDPGTMYAIADPTEGWWIEIAQGGQWIAQRVPDNAASMRANTFRIGEVNLNDKQNVLYSPDLLKYAEEKGWYKPKDKKPFNFAQVYGDPKYLDHPNNIVRHEMIDGKLKEIGKNFTARDLMKILRWHYEGTEMDKTDGYAISPHDRQATGRRPVCNLSTEVSSVAQLRGWLPAEIGGVLWLNMGTPCSGVYIPYNMGTKEFALPFTEAADKYSPDSAYWTFFDLTMMTDLNYEEFHEIVHSHWVAFEENALALQPAVDTQALVLYRQRGTDAASDFLTWYSKALANQAFLDAKDLVSKLKTLLYMQ